MRIRFLVATGAPLLAGLALGTAASAAPALPAAPSPSTSLVDRVDLVTKCWETPSGRRRCRTVYVNPYKYNDPKRYPVGSTEWWRAMDRNGSGGYRR